jgi:hypothetical protein
MNPQQPEQNITPQTQDDSTDDQKPDHDTSDSEATAKPAGTWLFNDTEDSVTLPRAKSVSKPSRSSTFSWTASEFVEHTKNLGWYVGLIMVAIILAALVFIITRDKISTGMVIIAALALGIFATRKPRTLEYRLDDTGLTIGTKFYSYEGFKSFSVIDEGPVHSVFLMPMKRFMPGLSLYYDQKDQQKIADILAQRLPLEDRHVDTIDRFMHRIRF